MDLDELLEKYSSGKYNDFYEKSAKFAAKYYKQMTENIKNTKITLDDIISTEGYFDLLLNDEEAISSEDSKCAGVGFMLAVDEIKKLSIEMLMDKYSKMFKSTNDNFNNSVDASLN